MLTRKHSSLVNAILFGLFLAGCVPSQANSTKVSTAFAGSTGTTELSATPIAAPTHTKTPVKPGPIPTFPPTIQPLQENYLRTLLRAANCELPCYLGITPGETSWEDAQTILGNIGANFETSQAAVESSGLLEYAYYSLVGDPLLINATRTPNMGMGYAEIFQSMDFTVGADVVQRIEANVQTTKFPQKFGLYWSKYSLQSIFKEFGPPDLVFFGIQSQSGGYVQEIVYSHRGIVISTSGIRTDRSICPILPSYSGGAMVDTGFVLTNPNSSLDIYGPGVPPTDRSVFLPIQESLGISVDQYYRQVMADEASCFTVKQMTP